MGEVEADRERWDAAEQAFRTGLGLDPHHEELASRFALFTEMSARTAGLAEAYRACADVLDEFQRKASLARGRVVNARDWAYHAREEWAKVELEELHDHVREERAAADLGVARDHAREAREWEEERQEAISVAKEAVEASREAEASPAGRPSTR